MRNRYLMVLVAGAAIVAACSDTINLNNEVRQATQNDKIGFVTYSEKATRAADSNSVNMFDFHKAFDVYAWKTAVGGDQVVFDHTPVEYFTSQSTEGTYVYTSDFSKLAQEWGDSWATDTRFRGWFYEEVRYWDKLASNYNFYAIAPYEPTPTPAITIANGDYNITIGSDSARYKVSTEKNLAVIGDTTLTNERKYFGFNKDYMLADKSSTKNELVTLTFHHILTKLNVKITLTDAYKGTQPFTIKGLTIAGLEDEGYFAYDTVSSKNIWFSKKDSTYSLTDTTDYILKNVPAGAADTTEYSGYYWFQTLVFPQTLTCDTIGELATAPNNKYLHIEYAIGNEPFERFYDLAYVFGCTTKEANNKTYNLKQGSEYTINILVGPEPIVFKADASKWADDVEIDHDVE